MFHQVHVPIPKQIIDKGNEVAITERTRSRVSGLDLETFSRSDSGRLK